MMSTQHKLEGMQTIRYKGFAVPGVGLTTRECRVLSPWWVDEHFMGVLVANELKEYTINLTLHF